MWKGDDIQLTPRYGADPIIVLDGDPGEIAAPAISQRRRFAEVLAGLSEEQWAHPSRCEGWSSRDVIIHLDSANTFWAFSIAQGLAGAPTEFLATFDPVASPAEMVAAASDLTSAEVLARFTASTEALCAQWESLDAEGWSTIAEAPPGHVTISALSHHALWDSWVHERDILLPLAVEPERHGDEITAGLRYAAALGPAFALSMGSEQRGSMAITSSDPDLGITVDVDHAVTVRAAGAAVETGLRLTGSAVDLLESLSTRRPLDQPVPDESAWMLNGLLEVFDLDPT